MAPVWASMCLYAPPAGALFWMMFRYFVVDFWVMLMIFQIFQREGKVLNKMPKHPDEKIYLDFGDQFLKIHQKSHPPGLGAGNGFCCLQKSTPKILTKKIFGRRR